MAKCRIGHFVEAQVLEAIGVDYIDESEVLTPADEPTISETRLQGALCVRLPQPGRGAAPIRGGGDDPHQGEAGTGDVVEAVAHERSWTASGKFSSWIRG
jgi:pyridoxal 5'-phosphate synthase pdxS subunit